MSSKEKPELAGFKMDPGAFNAALFEAYKSTCNCAVCKILRKSLTKALSPYVPKKGDE